MRILVFGATGSIGNYLYEKLKDNNVVVGTSTRENNKNFCVVSYENYNSLIELEPFDSLIWAQGANTNDDINSFDISNFTKIVDANVTFILSTLNFLLKHNKINKNSNLIIISSIWETNTRDSKLSYSISKGCLANLTKSVAYDLAKDNILVNNVLPGPIDNDMTRKTLSSEELEYVKKYTNFNRLINLKDIFNLVNFLINSNTGITGQSIKVDLGFTNINKYE